MILTRRNTAVRDGVDAFNEFCDILDQFKDHIYTPMLLAFVVILHLIRFIDVDLKDRLVLIRDTEAKVG